MEHLSALASQDICSFRQDLHQAKITEEEEAAKSAEEAMQAGMVRLRRKITTRKAREERRRKQEMVESLKQKPHKQPRSIEFFEALKRNEVLKCLNMIKQNPALVGDCDESRRTPLHWACHLNLTNIIQILVDFDSNLNAKDDYARKPLDEALAYS